MKMRVQRTHFRGPQDHPTFSSSLGGLPGLDISSRSWTRCRSAREGRSRGVQGRPGTSFHSPLPGSLKDEPKSPECSRAHKENAVLGKLVETQAQGPYRVGPAGTSERHVLKSQPPSRKAGSSVSPVHPNSLGTGSPSHQLGDKTLPQSCSQMPAEATLPSGLSKCSRIRPTVQTLFCSYFCREILEHGNYDC